MFFSVIVPVYNAEKTVRRAVESVMFQTCKDFELILVDDGSTDNSARTCIECGVDPRVRFIAAEHAGTAAARNLGVRAAAGEYIMFLDADDEYVPTALERVRAVLDDRRYDLVCFGASLIKRGGKTASFAPPEHIYENREKIQKAYLDIAVAPWFKSMCNKAYSRKLLQSGPTVNEELSIGEDKCFNIDLLSYIGNMRLILDELYVIRKTVGSLTERRDPEKFGQSVKAHVYMAKRLEEAGGDRAAAFIRYDWAHLCLSHFSDLFSAGAGNKRERISREADTVKYDYPARLKKWLTFPHRFEYSLFALRNITLIMIFCRLIGLKRGGSVK